MGKYVFGSCRRHYLDVTLENTAFGGKVLDVGGKKENQRGRFRPHLESVRCWEYVNVDPNVDPDFCCSADSIPVPKEVYDMVLSTELLEHVEFPSLILNECCRVLKPGGMILVSMPMLCPIHADPYDYQRWTPLKIKTELNKAGFDEITIRSMGGLCAVIHDLIRASVAQKASTSLMWKIMLKVVLPLVGKMIVLSKKNTDDELITTGYFAVAHKRQS